MVKLIPYQPVKEDARKRRKRRRGGGGEEEEEVEEEEEKEKEEEDVKTFLSAILAQDNGVEQLISFL